ncbi:MAG: methionine--tRNA ligase [Bacteroidetes bacterium]|uniref:Methionine--tRNA ligase n=1 Tax=Candidatus Cryptobacteroides avicola TaxID=2840757 RepID=A0A940II55_9BACT|nr:methionine--tRNA ligase [Candidatus Cryptobacteroides avicola]
MEKKDYRRTLVTCALPYANGPVHIGHLAGVYVPADIYVRYLRMKGEDVLFICGSDEHGVPITIKAKKEGCTPQDVVDRYHSIIKKSFEGFGINFDIYSRTSSRTHSEVASEFFRKMYDEGKFIEKESEQYFDTEANTFLADRYIVGTCPKCGNEGAYGDQCEKCGSTLSPDELLNPHSALSGSTPVKKKTKHWYLPLDRYEPWLKEWILDGHKEWRTNVYGQCKSWIDGGLQPRAVSRDLDWGVPVPVEGAEGKVLYVWFDAPIGYISNSKELLPQSWEKWWKSEDTRLVHFIGKDNIVFHCIVFPSMLKAYGGYILPDNVPANEFLNLEGNKISTSKNWAVWLNEYLEQFPGQEDVLRYVLCANAPETKDNDFTWKDFQARNNSELVAILGNFVNRAVVLTHKYFGGKVPADLRPEAVDKETLAQIPAMKKAVEENLENYKFREALKEAMNIARLGNKYLTDTEPWKVAKTDMDRTASILNVSLQICADLAIVFEPFLPFSAGKLRDILNVGLVAGMDHRCGEEGTCGENVFKPGEGAALHTVSCHSGQAGAEQKSVPVLSWEDLGRESVLPAGHQLGEAVLLFSKIEDSVVEAQVKRLEDTKKANEAAAAEASAHTVDPQKAECSFEDFEKMDIRTATVLEAERVPKTDKLLKLTIDTGIDKRVIVSGIAEYYTPEQMVGKQICILANLAPRKIRGIESKGMILMARQNDGKMRFITPQETLSNGAAIG